VEVNYLVTSPVKVDGIDAASLDVRVKDEASLIVVAKTNNVADEFLRFNARKWRIEIIGVAYVNRINAGHPGIDDKGIEFLAVPSVGTDLAMSTGTNGTGTVKQTQFLAVTVADGTRIGAFLPFFAVHFDVFERFAQL
jgi:hypothetical protein